MHSVIEHLRSHAPTNAAFFRVVGRSPRGEFVLFPRDANAFFGVGEAPRGLFPGLYQVFYFDAAGRQIQHARVELQLTEALAAALGPVEPEPVPRAAAVAEGAGRRALDPASSQLALPLPSSDAMSGPAPQQTDLAVEQARHKMALENTRQKQEFAQNAMYQREVAESFLVNRMMRQEMVELQANMQRNSDKEFEDLPKKLEALRQLRQAQKETLEFMREVERSIPPPPPQRVDWLPLANEALGTIGVLGKALVEAWVTRSNATKAGAAPAEPDPVKPKDPGVAPPAAAPPPSSPGKLPPSVIDWNALRERPESD